MTRKIQSIALLTVLTLLLAGCVAPVVENYTAFQDKSFSARTRPAKLFEGDVADLMQSGYLLIGYIDFKHNIQICYDNNSCTIVSKNDRTLDELLKRSARRGADRVQVLYSSLKLVPKTLSICTGYTTTTYTDKDGHIHYLTVCASYARYDGYMESWTKRALLWRYAPKLASADNNYRAVRKALAILHHNKSEQKKVNASVVKKPIETANPIVKHKQAGDGVYGAQLVAAIASENYDFLGRQLGGEKLIKWQHRYRVDLLMLALEMRKTAVYRWLIAKPVNWTQENRTGYSALEYAIAFAHPVDVESMLKKHPELSARFSRRRKIYMALAALGSPDMLKYLLTKGFSINGRVGEYSLLYLAVANGNEALANQLLAMHARVRPRNRNEPAPLLAAIAKQNYSLVAALLQHGARVNVADKLGNTPLLYAAGYGTPAIVKLLIDHGAELNVLNKAHCSPLYAALAEGRWKSAELLMHQRISYAPPKLKVFAIAVRGMLYESPASTLDMYLKKTNLLRINALRPLLAVTLMDCAKYCSEKKMSVFLDNGVNMYYAPKGKSLFQWAYESKNIGALKAMIHHGYRSRNRGTLSALQSALVVGDATLVKAYRLAEVEEYTKAEKAGSKSDHR